MNTRNLWLIDLQNQFDHLECSNWMKLACSNFQQLFYKKVLKRILCTTFPLDLRKVAFNTILLHRVTLTNPSEILLAFAKITAVFNNFKENTIICAVFSVVNVRLEIILIRKFWSSKMDLLSSNWNRATKIKSLISMQWIIVEGNRKK